MMMTMTIDRQLARLARDIAAAGESDARTTQPEARCDLEHLERRAQSTARALAEQLGTHVEAGEDEIDVAMALIVDRLLAGQHAASIVGCSSALAA